MPGLLTQFVPENETALSQAARKYMWEPMGQMLESPNVQALMDALDQANRNVPPVPGVGYAKPLLAMIPTAAKLPKFLQKMREAQAFAGAAKTAEKVASLYTHARYPKRAAKMAAETKFESNPIARALGQMGSFNRKAYDAGTPSINLQTKGLFSEPEAKEYVDTLAHEGQHLLDYGRAAKDRSRAGLASVTGTPPPERISKVTINDFIPQEEGGNYISFTKDKDAYKAQPVEARAFKGGDTAKKGYQKFLSMVEDAYLADKRKRPFSVQAQIRSEASIDRFRDAVWKAAREKAATEPPGVSDTAIFLDAFEKAVENAKAGVKETQQFLKDRSQYESAKNAYYKVRDTLPIGDPVRNKIMNQYFDTKIPEKRKLTPRFIDLLPSSKGKAVLVAEDKWTPYYAKALENLGFNRYNNWGLKKPLSTIGGTSTEDAILTLLGQ